MAPEKLLTAHVLTLLIVDKEPSFRSELNELCRCVSGLQVLGEAESGRAAIDAAESLSPDVMVIDVALPDMSGFDVLRCTRSHTGRLGIMTSEQPDLAERAATAGAAEYLSKPFSVSRFVQTIERIRQRFEVKQTCDRQTVPPFRRFMCRRPPLLLGERHRRLYPLDIGQVDYIEADGNYVTIRVGNDEYLSRDSIKRLAAELAEFDFIRIDRSVLLNIRAVNFAEPVGHGVLAFTLASGTCLHSSKRYREEILRLLPWNTRRTG